MHLFHIPQYSIKNRNVHISVLNEEALLDMEQVHSGICEIGLLRFLSYPSYLCLAAQRLNGYVVAVSDQAPPVVSGQDIKKAPGIYSYCGKLDRKTRASGREILNCNKAVKGRFLYIYLERADYLTMCEVKVFKDCKYMQV